MSRPIIISSHQGIAPRYDPALKKGFARTAENCDLSSGKIKPLADAVLQKADTNLYNSLFFYNGAWQTGNNKHYLNWKIGNFDLLIYLSGGVPYKKVNGTAAPLGQTRLGAPTLESQTARTTLDITADPYGWTRSKTMPIEYLCVTYASIRNSSYKWTSSPATPNEYYCEAAGGGDPGLTPPDALTMDLMVATKGTLGTLAVGEWNWGDNDTLGYNTVYVRLVGDADPDTKDNDFIFELWDPTLSYPDRLELGSDADANEGTTGSLLVGEWDYGDNDSLGFNTIYVRLIDDKDPDGKVDGYIKHHTETNPGNLNDTYTYVLTTTRNVNGYKDESGPSAVSSEIIAEYEFIRITRPAISDSNVTYWNIYRISNSSGAYQFVAQVAAGTSTYDDNNADADLGASPTTWYTSDQGNSIGFDKPKVTFDGLITEPFTGMIFAWKGSTLYWSEPGYPDAWPSFYNMNMPSDIKRVIPFAGTVSVLTETGPLRVDGTHPELLQPSKVLGEEPCIGTAACKTSKGVAYLSDSGTVLFNLAETIVVSDDRFTEDWFKNNVSSAGAFMIENDGVLYLFHSAGVLVVDTRPKTAIWFTLDIIAYAAHVRPDTGDLYYIDSAGVQKLFGGSGSLTWTWQSGDIVGAHPGDKPFQGIEVRGSGTITATLYADGLQQATKALSFTMERNRTLNFSAEINARAAQYKLTGTGQVDEVVIRYSP